MLLCFCPQLDGTVTTSELDPKNSCSLWTAVVTHHFILYRHVLSVLNQDTTMPVNTRLTSNQIAARPCWGAQTQVVHLKRRRHLHKAKAGTCKATNILKTCTAGRMRPHDAAGPPAVGQGSITTHAQDNLNSTGFCRRRGFVRRLERIVSWRRQRAIATGTAGSIYQSEYAAAAAAAAAATAAGRGSPRHTSSPRIPAIQNHQELEAGRAL